MTREQAHKVISYWKSGIRIFGYGALLGAAFSDSAHGVALHIGIGAVVLVVSEVLGIAEEVWGA